MSKLKGLLLTEGLHGMISQVEGLAKALNLEYFHEKIELNNFWKLIPPSLTPVKKYVFKNNINKEFDIIINRGNGTKEKINYLNFLREGDLKSNPTFLEGDIIHVPFGDPYLNSVSLRGHIENAGYDIIEKNESLLSFLNRSINLINETNLMSIIVTRNENGKDKIYNISPKEFSNFILSNGDIVDVPRDDGVMVNGFVQKPGAYAYVPGYLAYNYISMAGGNTKDGSINKIKIIHSNGTSSRNANTILKRGDVIIVERSTINTLAGNMSILQIVASLLTIYMTYLSSSK